MKTQVVLVLLGILEVLGIGFIAHRAQQPKERVVRYQVDYESETVKLRLEDWQDLMDRND